MGYEKHTEQFIMDRLVLKNDNPPSKRVLRLPLHGKGSGTPNHAAQRRACGLIVGEIGIEEEIINLYNYQKWFGHCSKANSSEQLSPSHAGRHYVAAGAILHIALERSLGRVVAGVEGWWLNEFRLMHEFCTPLGFVAPGARRNKPKKDGSLNGFSFDRNVLGAALESGDKKDFKIGSKLELDELFRQLVIMHFDHYRSLWAEARFRQWPKLMDPIQIERKEKSFVAWCDSPKSQLMPQSWAAYIDGQALFGQEDPSTRPSL